MRFAKRDRIIHPHAIHKHGRVCACLIHNHIMQFVNIDCQSDRPFVRRMIMMTDNMQASLFYRFFRSTPFGLIIKFLILLIGLLYFFIKKSGVSSLMALILFFLILGIIIVKIARNHGFLGGKQDSTDDTQSDDNWM